MFVYEMRFGEAGGIWRFREITAFMRVFYCTSAVLDLTRKSNCEKRMKQSVFSLINHKVAKRIKINLWPPFFFLPTAVIANDHPKADWHFTYQLWCLLLSFYKQITSEVLQEHREKPYSRSILKSASHKWLTKWWSITWNNTKILIKNK